MAAGATYTPIATATGNGSSTITFSSISGSYTDLVLVISGLATSNGDAVYVQFNSDTNKAKYSWTWLYGNGTSAASSRRAANVSAAAPFNWATGWSNTNTNNAIMQINNYSNSTTYKTWLSRSNTASATSVPGTEAIVGLYQSTSAISSIQIFDGGGNLASGFTATLYGILAA